MTKKSRQKFKYLENQKSFLDETRNIFHHFWRAIIEVIKKKNLGGESPTLITRIFISRMPQPRYCFTWDVEKVLGFLFLLDSEKIELKMLTYKVTMLLALTGPSRSHYLDIRFLIKHSSGYTFHFNKLTKTATRPPIKYLNFSSKKIMCLLPYWPVLRENTKDSKWRHIRLCLPKQFLDG